MSGPRVVYLERADAGARLTRVRVVGLSGDHVWTADPRLPFAEVVAGAGAWLADTLPGKTIDVLCVDTSGAIAAWLDTPEGRPEEARALVEQSIAGVGHAGPEDDHAGAPGRGPLEDDASRFPGLPGESSVEALPPVDDDADRLGVMVQPDALVRLLLDDLDRRKISVGRVVSLWHLLAWAWRPAERTGSWNGRENGNGSGNGDRVVSESHPATAMVIGDPTGRLVWAWSVDGNVVASGGHRLSGARDHATIRTGDVPRLVHDWMSWSSQTGVAPDRIRIVADFSNGAAPTTPRDALGPDEQEDSEEHADPSAHEQAQAPGALAARDRNDDDIPGGAGVARALGQRWPDAAVDVVDLADPIGETLLRAARHADQSTIPGLAPTTGLGSLSHRRGRAHRAMYRWGGLAMVALALVLFVAAWGVRQDGQAARQQANDYTAERLAVLNALNQRGDLDVMLNLREFPDQAIQNAIDAMSQRVPTDPERPILRELETMALVLGSPDVALFDVTFTESLAQLSLATPDTQTAEAMFDALRSIGGSGVRWRNRVYVRDVTVNGETWGQWSFTGSWIDPADLPAGASEPGTAEQGAGA